MPSTPQRRLAQVMALGICLLILMSRSLAGERGDVGNISLYTLPDLHVHFGAERKIKVHARTKLDEA